MQARHRAATNQPEPLIGHDVITSDAALVDAVRRFGGVTELDDSSSVLESLKSLGQLAAPQKRASTDAGQRQRS